MAVMARRMGGAYSSGMLETATMETFLPHIGQTFRFVVDENSELTTKLTEVTPWGPGASANRPRAPFSLVFHSLPNTFLPQSIYRVESNVVEPLELFIVCLGPDELGMRYEAVIT